MQNEWMEEESARTRNSPFKWPLKCLADHASISITILHYAMRRLKNEIWSVVVCCCCCWWWPAQAPHKMSFSRLHSFLRQHGTTWSTDSCFVSKAPINTLPNNDDDDDRSCNNWLLNNKRLNIAGDGDDDGKESHSMWRCPWSGDKCNQFQSAAARCGQ